MAFRPVEPSKSPVQDGQKGYESSAWYELTVDDQDLPGSLLLGQSIEDGVYGFTEDDTVGANFLRRTKVLVFEGVWFDVVQDITGNIWLPATLLEVFQSRFDRNNIVGVIGTLDIGKSLSEKTIL